MNIFGICRYLGHCNVFRSWASTATWLCASGILVTPHPVSVPFLFHGWHWDRVLMRIWWALTTVYCLSSQWKFLWGPLKRVRRLTFFSIYGTGIHKGWIHPRKLGPVFSLKEGVSPRRGVDSRRLVIAAWCFELSPWESLAPLLPVGGTRRAWEEVSHCKYLP